MITTLSRYWNVNQFPIRATLLRMLLGSTNSRLTTHCREILTLSVAEFPTRLCCYYRQYLQWRTVHWISRPSFVPTSTPTYHAFLSERSGVSAVGFSPVHFRGFRPRQMSCYALFGGWLLLSLPSCCLWSKTPFGLTLSQHLGALTPVWVNPLAVMSLTPHKPASRLLRR